MGFDLLVWEWAANTDWVDPEEVAQALAEDDPHPAITRFDMRSLESAIRASYGDVNAGSNGPPLHEVSDFTGAPASWVRFSIDCSQGSKIGPVLTEIAKLQGLAVYDPQENKIL